MQQSKEQDALLSSAESRNSYSLKGPSTPSIGSVFSPNGNSKGSNGAGSNTSAHFKGQVSTPGSLNRSRDSYLGAMTPDSRKKFYKGTSNMSTTGTTITIAYNLECMTNFTDYITNFCR